MTLDRITDSLPIPVVVARSLVVNGEHSARDLAYGLTAAVLAGQRDPSTDGKPVSIPGNGFRYALGMTRRDRQEIENGRVERMLDATLTVDGLEGPVAMPSMQIMRQPSGASLVLRMGLRVAGDAQQQWHVDPSLASAMRKGEKVDLPWTLIQGAKHKSTIPIMLRLLAWIAGTDPAYVKQRENRWEADLFTGEHLVLEIPPSDLFASLGLPAKSKPAVVMARMLEPAAAEITRLTGYVVRFTEMRTTYRAIAGQKPREGRLMAFRIEIDVPLMITRPARPVARVPGKPWKPLPKWHKPPKPQEPAPALIADIAIDDDDDFDPYDFLDEPSGQPAPVVPVSDAPRRSRFGGQRNR